MSKTYINSYASVLFEIAYDKKQINNYLDMSERLLVCLKNDDTHLFHVINNLAYSKTERKQIMSSILKILNAHPLEHFIWTIIDLEKTNYICRIFECFEKKVYGILEQPLVNIESAFVLTKTEVTQIVKKIESIINKKIHYKLSVNKDLIGGIRVVSEKFSYDNTIQTKLKLIKEELFE